MGNIDMGKMLLPNCQLCGGFRYEQELSFLPIADTREQTSAKYLTAIARRRSRSRRLLMQQVFRVKYLP